MEQERKIAEDAAKEQAIKFDTEKKAKANAETKKASAKKAVKEKANRGYRAGISYNQLASISDQYLDRPFPMSAPSLVNEKPVMNNTGSYPNVTFG
ncbi:MAG TPA: hypothetical protein VNU45_17190 [Rummeliibacillus sp.]|nr:hypothetical protein [Rummeliibacillus sp.]